LLIDILECYTANRNLTEKQFPYTPLLNEPLTEIKQHTDMKKIEAIIRRIKFEDVKEALLEADIEWFSYYDVRGIGKSRQGRVYRGVVYDTSSIERILVSVVVRDKNVEKTVEAILKASQTGEIGDGRIFVIPIQDAIRIRTGERGDIALYNAELEQ
jgi:nitrogen regulatory protein P-II 1